MNNNINFKNGPVVIMEGNSSEPYHMHRNSQELIWVLEGEAGITFNNKEYILNASDDLILLVDADFHMIRQISDKLRYLSFYIDLPYFEKHIKDILHVGLYCNPGYRPPEQIPYLREMRKLLAHIVWEYRSDESSQQIRKLTTKLLLLLRNHFNFLGTTSIDYKDKHTFDRMFKVYDFVYQHYTERVTLADLADQIHVSRTYLSRSVKHITGMCFKDILNYVRCEEAVRLLLETDKSVTAISYDCGFSDPKFFNQYFARFFHGNPVEFRKAHKTPQEIDFLVNHQHKINYDENLLDRLGEYWNDLDLQGAEATHLSYDIAGEIAGVETAWDLTTILVVPQDFSTHRELPELLQECGKELGPIQLEITPAEFHRGMVEDTAQFTALQNMLEQKRVHLFCEAENLCGLYMAGSIKTPLYYILSIIHHANGLWENGNHWTMCHMIERKGILLLSWNSSVEKNMEFQIDFQTYDKRLLSIRYEFFKDTLQVLRYLSSANLLDGFWNTGTNTLKNICAPSCSTEIVNASEFGFSFKVRPGRISILLLQEI